MSEWLTHGGEVDIVAERYGIPRDQWLDLSTGINPNPYPVPDLSREYWYRLPDAQLLNWLVESACAYFGVGDARCVIPAPGTQALIQWLPRLIEPRRVAIVSPTYEEHKQAWSAAGHEIIEIMHGDIPPPGTSVIIVVNPNNPDGTTLQPHHLLPLAQSTLLIVDEAFADVMPEISLASHAGHGNLVVLRSFGKFFGLAGMRLGFALAPASFAERLKHALGPWAVPGPAAAVGAIAMTDETWIRVTRVRLKAASSRLDGLLMRSGLKPLGGTTLFRLVADERALDLYHHLAQQGVLTRRFPDNPHWLRFGLPADDEEFDRLAASLGSWRPRAQRATASGGEWR